MKGTFHLTNLPLCVHLVRRVNANRYTFHITYFLLIHLKECRVNECVSAHFPKMMSSQLISRMLVQQLFALKLKQYLKTSIMFMCHSHIAICCCSAVDDMKM